MGIVLMQAIEHNHGELSQVRKVMVGEANKPMETVRVIPIVQVKRFKPERLH